MKNRKAMFIFLIILIFPFSWSYQDSRRPHQDRWKKENSLSLKKIPSFRYDGPLYVPGEVLVKFKPSLSEQKIESMIGTYNSRKLKRIPRVDIFQVQIPEGAEVMEMVSLMNQDPDIEYAEPNYIVHMVVTPNDPLFIYQYALSNQGQDIGVPGSPRGTSRADIKASEKAKGDRKAHIAFVCPAAKG